MRVDNSAICAGASRLRILGRQAAPGTNDSERFIGVHDGTAPLANTRALRRFDLPAKPELY